MCYEGNESAFIGNCGYFNVAPPEDENVLRDIQFKLLDQYYFEILGGYANEEHISPLISRLKSRFDMLDKVFEVRESESVTFSSNVRIVDLKNVNLEIKR